MLNRFSQEKYEESRKHELLEQEKEEDNKGYNARTELCQKQEFLDRKQESSEDIRQYYGEKRKLWVFDIGETPTGKEIKAMLDRQLSSDRYEIRNTFSQSFETM